MPVAVALDSPPPVSDSTTPHYPQIAWQIALKLMNIPGFVFYVMRNGGEGEEAPKYYWTGLLFGTLQCCLFYFDSEMLKSGSCAIK